MEQQPNTEAPQGAVPLDCKVRVQFEEWAKEQGLIAVSHGIRSESAQLGLAWAAWNAATKIERDECAELSDNFPTLFGFHSCFSVAREIRKREAL